LAGTTVLFTGAAYAQGVDFSKVEIGTIDLGNKTYMLTGQGGNITVAVGTDGIIMVDAQFAPLHDKIKAAITKIRRCDQVRDQHALSWRSRRGNDQFQRKRSHRGAR